MTKILIAIPTAKNIEAETFKSIFNLKKPEGVTLDFQYFYGYRVDQVRNLIADWVIKGGYDYLFSVDHDISFESDTLIKMLNHNVKMISGIYRQRLEPQVLEIYDLNYKNWDISNFTNLVEIGGCGFGCVLVHRSLFETVKYPQFEYHQALDHLNTLSEDVDFCMKLRKAGVKIYADPSIKCGHMGTTTFNIQVDPIQIRLRDLADQRLLPESHKAYLPNIKLPKFPVIYDIGSCVMHWTKEAKMVWEDSTIFCFEAMGEVKFLYDELNIPLIYGNVLGDVDNREVEFYQNLTHPGGNSIYKENPELSPLAKNLFPEECKIKKIMMTLDTLVEKYNLPQPHLIKMDVQGAEMKVLKGAEKTLRVCNELILELQHVDYNMGAEKANEVIEYLQTLGFSLVNDKMFSGNELSVDGDYHFSKF